MMDEPLDGVEVNPALYVEVVSWFCVRERKRALLLQRF